MKSQKNLFLFIIGILALALSSCTSLQVFDDALPESEQTTANFSMMKVTSYNGIAVNWEKAKFPAGSTVLGANVDIIRGGLKYELRGMEFSYRFMPETEYYVMGTTKDMKWGVHIYDKPPASGFGSQPEPLAFIPFVNQPVFNKGENIK